MLQAHEQQREAPPGMKQEKYRPPEVTELEEGGNQEHLGGLEVSTITITDQAAVSESRRTAALIRQVTARLGIDGEEGQTLSLRQEAENLALAAKTREAITTTVDLAGTNLESLPLVVLEQWQDKNVLGDHAKAVLSVLSPEMIGRNPNALMKQLEGQIGIKLTPEQAKAFVDILSANKDRIVFVESVRLAVEAKRMREESRKTIEELIRKYDAETVELVARTANPEAAKRLQDSRRAKFSELTETLLFDQSLLEPGAISQEILDILETPDVVHSMDICRYAENRLSALMLEQVIAEKMQVEIYTGNPVAAIAKLQNEGFSQIMTYATQDGDFKKFMVTNPSTKESKLAIMTLPGKSYRLQIEGALLLYKDKNGQGVSPEQVKVFESKMDLGKTYQDILNSYKVKPETIVIGNQMEVARILEERGIEEFESIRDPYLNATIYRFSDAQGKERTILSVNITPYLYGDKLISFTEVAAKMGTERIVFTGTAGGLGEDLKIGDIVVPENVVYANPGSGQEPLALPNAAQSVLSRLKGANLRSVPRHGTVHTPVIETMPFIQGMREQRIDTVECEIANVAQGIANSGQKVDFHYYVRISDIPGTEHTLAAKDVRLDPSYEGKPLEYQGSVTAAILEQELGLITGQKREYRGVSYDEATGLTYRVEKQETSGGVTKTTSVADDEMYSYRKIAETGKETKMNKKLKKEFAYSVELEGEQRLLAVTFSEPAVGDLASFEGAKRTMGNYVRTQLEQKPITKEVFDRLNTFANDVQKRYGLVANLAFRS